MVLFRHGVNLAGVMFDTMLASYLINPSKRAHSLEQIAMDFLDHRCITFQEVAGKGKNASFARVCLEKAVPYACEDADVTLKAYHVLWPILREIGLLELFEKVEMPLVRTLMDMEMRGVLVDTEKLQGLSKSFEYQLDQIEEKIYSIAGNNSTSSPHSSSDESFSKSSDCPYRKKPRRKQAIPRTSMS